MKPELGLLSNLQFLMSLWSKLSLLEVGFPGLPCQRHLGASLTYRLAVCVLIRSPGECCAQSRSRCSSPYPCLLLHVGTVIMKFFTCVFVYHQSPLLSGLPWWFRLYSIHLQCRRAKFNPWVGKIPWRREWLPTPVSLLGESYGQRSLVGCSPWGHKELDMTE